MYLSIILRDFDAKSALKVEGRMENHPPTKTRKTIRGILRKMRIVGMTMVVDTKEIIIIHDVTTTEARPDITMVLTDPRTFAEARRDKTAVTAR